jgi:hypothetical protein
MWYYVYILELNNGNHYTGCTVNLKERYNRHTKERVPATKPHLPLNLYGAALFPIDIKLINLKITSNPVQEEHLLLSVYFDLGSNRYQ